MIPPQNLRCEGLVDPLGIDVVAPRLTWWSGPAERVEHRVVEHRVVVASSAGLAAAGDGDLWDSGALPPGVLAVTYQGPALGSRRQCWWAVGATAASSDGDGDGPAWSAPATWSMGLLDPGDWTARWITWTAEPAGDRGARVIRVRRAFDLDAAVTSARLYATALGLYELHLNGARVSSDRFTPGWTDYGARVQYRVHDVADLLDPGRENVLGVTLGEGWFSGHVGPERGRHHYGDTPQVLVQLEVETSGGSLVVATGDGGWRAAAAPHLWSDLLMGESFDARLEHAGWDRPGFDDRDWPEPTLAPRPNASLVATLSPPVRAVTVVKPVSVSEPDPGTHLFDLGQNIVGWARLEGDLPAGSELTLRFGEVTDGDGRLYTENLRGAVATEHYVTGGGPFTYEPTFTYHGFRYVELTGWPPASTRPTSDTIAGIVAHSDLPVTGDFACSSPLVDRIFANSLWSQRGNFVDVPTDCPQRDERLGWMGDAGVFVGTAAYLMAVDTFFAKWLQDVEDARVGAAFPDVAPRLVVTNPGSPAWGDAGVIVPWTLFQRYGDLRVLHRHYPAMRAWVEWVAGNNPGLVWADEVGNDYGDWLCIDAIAPKRVVATAFFAQSAATLADVAAALGREADAAAHRDLAERIADTFRAEFVGPDGAIEGEAQTAYALALRFGLVHGAQRRAVEGRLVADVEARGHLTTGFVGIRHLLPALTGAGRIDLAYRLLEHDGYPSWGYSIARGATTMWERWDGWTEHRGFQDPRMNSFNHYALGAVTEWLFDTVAGIRPAAPGFGEVEVAPRPGGSLRWARARYDSVRGEIASGWVIEGDGAGRTLQLDVVVPAATPTTLVLPPGASILEGIDGAAAIDHRSEPDKGGTLALRAGRHQLRCRYPDRGQQS